MNNQLQKNNSLLGFTTNKTALQAGKIEACLSKVFRYDCIVMERRDAMLKYLREGKIPAVVETVVNGKNKKSYRLNFTIDGTNVFNEITKTEYDFCLYLIKNDLVSEENVNAYLASENEKAAEADRTEEETRKAEAEAQEKEEAERASFKMWLRSSAEMYEGTTKGNLMEQIFVDKYGEFTNRIGAYETLVNIDNIDNDRCRQALKERLHTDNKASRKVFECVTGLKLPKTNKETMEFLDNVQKSDYKEMVEYRTRVKNEKADAADEDNTRVFYILEFDPKEKEKLPVYTKILAEPITKKGFDCFIHEMPDGRYGISSVECGMRLSAGNTKAQAVKELKRVINKYGEIALRKHIEDAVKRFGASPASNQVA